jgi:hypothetical protein
MVTSQELTAAIEGSFFAIPEIPGVIARLSIPGVTGIHGPMSTPEMNTVGLTRLDDETVDATIDQVIQVFREEGKRFAWLVSPSSRPADLAEHLTRRGLVFDGGLAGMVLTDLARPMVTNPAVRVVRLDERGIRTALPRMLRAYGMPDEVVSARTEFMATLGAHTEFWLYLAYRDGSDEPVAFASSFLLPDKPIVVLQGAGTLTEQRGQGIYSTMVAARLADARERGVEAAVIQADRTTSAPIVRKLGFEEVTSLESYGWEPAAQE